MTFKAWVLFSFFSVVSNAVTFSTACYEIPSHAVKYCVHTPTSGLLNSEDLIYYLHGAGGNEHTWENESYYTGQVRRWWDKTNWPSPQVVSVSFGALWFLIEKNPNSGSGLLEVFTSVVIPEVENKIGGLKGRRVIWGDSMGGFNAAQLAFKTRLFTKAAIVCAPLTAISPFSSQEKIENFVKNSSAWKHYEHFQNNPVMQKVRDMLGLLHQFFPTEEDWNEADPIQVVAKSGHINPGIYLTVGYFDEFAAYEGNEKLAGILESKGVSLDWRPQWGGHCVVDVPSLAKFLSW